MKGGPRRVRTVPKHVVMMTWLQMGSYFGSSLCAVDLNMDGLSDLLVGAPMFSEIRDEGQVTVYLNQGHVSTKWAMRRRALGKDIHIVM